MLLHSVTIPKSINTPVLNKEEIVLFNSRKKCNKPTSSSTKCYFTVWLGQLYFRNSDISHNLGIRSGHNGGVQPMDFLGPKLYYKTDSWQFFISANLVCLSFESIWLNIFHYYFNETIWIIWYDMVTIFLYFIYFHYESHLTLGRHLQDMFRVCFETIQAIQKKPTRFHQM